MSQICSRGGAFVKWNSPDPECSRRAFQSTRLERNNVFGSFSREITFGDEWPWNAQLERNNGQLERNNEIGREITEIGREITKSGEK